MLLSASRDFASFPDNFSFVGSSVGETGLLAAVAFFVAAFSFVFVGVLSCSGCNCCGCCFIFRFVIEVSFAVISFGCCSFAFGTVFRVFFAVVCVVSAIVVVVNSCACFSLFFSLCFPVGVDVVDVVAVCVGVLGSVV